MRTRVEARGPASAKAMWSAYSHTGRWRLWAPHIQRVDPEGPLVAGMRGVVHGPAGSNARFEVTSVDPPNGRWTWRVRSGPVRLTIDHEVADGMTAVVIDGLAPFVLAYAPVARLSLERLVRSSRD